MGHHDFGDTETSQLARVYQEIKWRIVYGRYRPGTHVSEATLGRVCHASRTPIREALTRLSADGYVVWVPGRGFLIAPITVTMVKNTFQLRRILETAAGERAAMVATLPEIGELRRLAGHSGLPADEHSYRLALAANVDFHLAIAKATHNDLLVDSVYGCLMQIYRVLSLGGNVIRFEESVTDHNAIVDAIEARNPDQARAEVERHIDRAADVIMEDVIDGRIKGLTF
ncbi:MAG: GntR family transcriptional regulator [Acidobacteria bacterium]|nr:GntR family transcriptional regulator [Acidobacteriota bacterium]